MPRVSFTDNIQRHVACPAMQVEGCTVAQALDAVFQQNPRARSYVLDEQGCLRRHMAIFINGQLIKDRERLSDSVSPTAEIYVMQALSGG